MLRKNSSAGGQTMDPEEIREFLHKACQSGQHLASEDSREGAQSILDYWTGQLLSRQPEKVAELGSYFLADFVSPATAGEENVSTEETLAQQLATLRNSARELARSLFTDDRKHLRHLLLHLIKFPPGCSTPHLTSLPNDAPILQRPEFASLLERLEKAGLLKREAEAVHLADESLLKSWDEAAAVCNERRSFRDLTSGWDQGGQEHPALLRGGSQIANAQDYQDLTDLELAFLKASQQASQKQRVQLLSVWSTVLAVLLCLVVLGMYLLKKKNDELEAANRNLSLKIEQYEEANRKAKTYAQAASLRLEQSQDLQTELDQVDLFLGRAVDEADSSEIFAEIFVADTDPALVEKARYLITGLKKAGIVLPVEDPIAKKRVAHTTEVRYFYPEDLECAVTVREEMIKAGFKAEILPPKFLDDSTAPKKFIQVSVAADALP